MRQFVQSIKNNLEVKQHNKERIGEYLVHIVVPVKTVKVFKTSKTVPNNRLIDSNLRSVMATTSVGGGLSTLRRLCVEMNVPPPVNEHLIGNISRRFL